MTLPTWEIVIITIIALTIVGVSVYAFIRCCKSVLVFGDEATKRRQTPRANQSQSNGRSGRNPPEVYGVPYQPPNVTPQQLNPSKLQAIVMEGQSDLHPHYLEKRDHIQDFDGSYIQREEKVTWNSDEILIESEFLPARLEVYANPSFSPDGESQKPKKKVVINYDKGADGAPEIKTMTTDTPLPTVSQEVVNSNTTQCNGSSNQELTSPSNQTEVTSRKPPQKRVLHISRDTWVDFDGDDANSSTA